jgi:hypothetical protein
MSDLERAVVNLAAELMLVSGGAMMAVGFVSGEAQTLMAGIAATLIGAMIRR